MKRTLILIVAGITLAPASHAGDVVKCTTEAGVSYQTEPCSEGTEKVLSLSTLSNTEAQSVTDATRIVPSSATATRPGAASIASTGAIFGGMSDMQVLNNRSWGKPQRITRNRAPRAWHEYWKYETGPNSGKQLHFINSKLADIEDLEPKVEAADTPPMAVIVEP